MNLLSHSRHIRIFISSTFEDMKVERDILTAQVFPQVRQLCQERSVEFTVIDLRWGIPKEVKELDEVVETCLLEVEHCHPFFLSLVGERYGKVRQGEKYQHLSERSAAFDWLKEVPEASVTELEICHFLSKHLAGDDVEQTAHFYFRDKAYSDSLPLEQQTFFVETDPQAQVKLASLKQKIRDSSLPITEYAQPQDLKELVYQQLKKLVNAFYPAGQELTTVERDRLEHDAFAYSRTRVYIERPADMARLTEHANSDAPPLVITGESGCGKSALLANWATAYRQQHPDVCVIWHFIGSSPKSTDHVDVLHHIMSELKVHFELNEEVPQKIKGIVEEFPLWLARATGKVIVILDGLNQLQEGGQKLDWLPAFIPAHIRLFISTLSGVTLTALEQRENWQVLQVALFNESERRQFIVEYLSRFYGKKLIEKNIALLVSAPQTANPLYLKVLLEELRVTGDYRELDKQIKAYLQAHDPAALYTKVLERLEQNYDLERSHLVKDALCFIWAARRGLTENELLGVLDTSPLVWLPLLAALQEVLALINRGGMLNFSHDYLRQAVQKRYLIDIETKNTTYKNLSKFFNKRSPFANCPNRMIDELPYLELLLGDIDTFFGILLVSYMHTSANPYKRLIYKYPKLNFEMPYDYRKHEYIPMFDAEHISSLVDASLPILWNMLSNNITMSGFNHEQNPKIMFIISYINLLEYRNNYSTRLLLNSTVILSENTFGKDSSQSIFYRAWFSLESLNFVDAEMLFTKVLSNELDHDGKRLLCTIVLYLVRMLLRRRGANCFITKRFHEFFKDIDPAMQSFPKYFLRNVKIAGIIARVFGIPLLKKEFFSKLFYRISLYIILPIKLIFFRNSLSTSNLLNRIANELSENNQNKKAEKFYRRSLSIKKKILGVENLSTATTISNLANVLYVDGLYSESESLYRTALSIRETKLGAYHTDTLYSINNLCVLLISQDKYSEAESLCQKAVLNCTSSFGKVYPATSRANLNLALLFFYTARYVESEKLYRDNLEIVSNLWGDAGDNTAFSLTVLANLYYELGRYDEAETLYRKGLVIRQKNFGDKSLKVANSSNALGNLLLKKGEFKECFKLQQTALKIRETIFGIDHPTTAYSLFGMANYFCSQGNYDKAEDLYKRVLKIRKKLFPHLSITARSINEFGHLFFLQNKYFEADKLYQEALYIYEKTVGREHPHTVALLARITELRTLWRNYL